MAMDQQDDAHGRRAPRTITPLSVPAIGAPDLPSLRFPLSQPELHALVKAALDEDGAFNDLTTLATVVSDRHASTRNLAQLDPVGNMKNEYISHFISRPWRMRSHKTAASVSRSSSR